MISRLLLTLVVCLPGAEIGGQSSGLSSQLADPQSRRLQRDWAFEYAGSSPEARAFVEDEVYGDDAAKTLLLISKPIARKLVAFHASGRLTKLPRPQAFFTTVSRNNHRDEIVLFTVKFAEELSEPDCFQAFLERPLEYALYLRKLSSGAAEVRARRTATASFNTSVELCSSQTSTPDLSAPSPNSSEIKTDYPQLPAFNDRALAGTAGLVLFVLLLIWRRRSYLARRLPA
jgi:hypothetical protein